MTELYLIYNPYRVQTFLYIKNSFGNYELVGGFSKLDWISNIRLQRWIGRSSSGFWKGFFTELSGVSGDNEFRVRFVGTEDDFNDFKKSAEVFTKSGGRVEMINENAGSQSSLTGKSKLSKLNRGVKNAKASAFYQIFPSDLRDYLDNGFVSREPEVLFLDLSSVSDAILDKVLAPDAWSCVYFCCDMRALNDEKICAKTRSIAARLISVDNIEAERERFSFVFYCKKDQLSDHKTKRMQKKFFLEQGIPNLPSYFVTAENKNELMKGHFDKKSPDDSGKLSNDLELYKVRYAEQIRLTKSCGVIKDYIEKYSLNKSSVRRTINVNDNGSSLRKSDSDTDRDLSEAEAISRLYEQLVSWDYRKELDNIVSVIKTEFRKTTVDYSTRIEYPGFCEEYYGSKYVKETDISAFIQWCKKSASKPVREQNEKTYAAVENKWLDVFYESFDEYRSSVPKKSSKWLPNSIGSNITLSSPVDLVNGIKISKEYVISNITAETVADKKLYEASVVFALFIRVVENSYSNWLDSYKKKLVNEVDRMVEDIHKRTLRTGDKIKKKDTLYLYRETVENEARVKDEAVKWINDFVNEINHLLDVGNTANRQEDH